MKTFEVTQEDIDTPINFARSMDCPVARSLRRSGYTNARVFTKAYDLTGRIWDWSNPRIWDLSNLPKLPIRVQRFIRKFDKGQPVKPFRFRLPI